MDRHGRRKLMHPRSIAFLAAALAFAAATAEAQSGNLAGVTMRVLDDVSDIDAVILELDRDRTEEAAERDGRSIIDDERSAADSEEDPAGESRDDRLEDDREADALHDADVDERSEGRLEDDDVERPAAAEPTP
jgi:hypothetical protein